MKELIASTLVNEVQKRIEDGCGFAWNEQLTEEVYRDFLQTTAQLLASHKSKDKPVAAVLTDVNGGFHFAAIVRFMTQNEEGGDEGSWNLSMTFDEGDINEAEMTVIKFHESPEFRNLFTDVAHAEHGIIWRFKEGSDPNSVAEGSPIQVLTIMFAALKEYMALNVTIDPELSIGDLVVFKSELSSDKVYIGVIPGATLKQLIKHDSSIGVVQQAA